jgi:hypothetical protein
MHAQARAGSGEHAQLGAQKLARTDEDHRAGLEIEKHRQEPHAILASPQTGLTGIIFYICLVSSAQRENFFFSSALQL